MTTPTTTDFAALGITLAAHASGEVRTTCPQCSATRRKSRERCLAVNVEAGTFYCHHCGYKGKVGSTQVIPDVSSAYHPPVPNEKRRHALQRTWNEAHPLTPEDPAMRYLTQRGLPLPANQIPPVLRYHPRLRYRPDDRQQPATYHPAMVARIDDADKHPVNLHRTYLTTAGQKAAVPAVRKWMTPAVAGGTIGGAIRLYRPGDTLCITEGIETGLAVHLATGLPVWAALCAEGMKAVQIPLSVQCVIICADHDHHEVGLHAAQVLAQRLLQERRQVKILLPDTVGTDWLDVFTDPQADPLTLARIEATPAVPRVNPQARTMPRAQPGFLAHRLPDHLRNHPDPRVQRHWQRLYAAANALKQRLLQDPYALVLPSHPEGALHANHD